MENIFGNTAPGILLLDFILIAMGLILSPLLWGIYKRLGENNSKVDKVFGKIAESNDLNVRTLSMLADCVKELHDARVRDKELEGRVKGVQAEVNRLREGK